VSRTDSATSTIALSSDRDHVDEDKVDEDKGDQPHDPAD